MSEQELVEKCNVHTGRRKLFWVSEIYGFGKVLREFGRYPSSWPLNIYLSHGLTISEKPAPHELTNDAPVMCYFSPRLVNAFKKESSKACYCVVSPNVFYRKSKRIVRSVSARGTLAFLAHTTAMIEDKLNLTKYIEQLKLLPEKFQPVTVCLHYHDVNKGAHKAFYDAGLDVVTVGSPFHDDFIERFYDILKGFRYATSNEIGSYTFYAPEMGIPFFLYGSEPELYNHGDTNIEFGKYDSYKRTGQYKKVRDLFKKPVDQVTEDQKRFVEEELGVYHSVSRLKMALILYGAFVNFGYLKFKIAVYKLITFKWIKAAMSASGVYLKRLGFHMRNYRNFGLSFAYSFWRHGKQKKVKVFGRTLSYNDEFWFLHGMKEIFKDKTYWVDSQSPSPYIIDCGSNIGLSLIFFKQLFPNARITAFEPDPSNFEVLRSNMASFGLNDLELHNKAIWTKNTSLQFSKSSNSVGSKVVDDMEISVETVSVEAVSLEGYLQDQVVDFLKIDIEGAELNVIRSCKRLLKNVKNLFIEYHSLPHESQELDELLLILRESGFRYYIKEAWENLKHPYVSRKTDMFDLQLNIFAYR